MLTHAAQRGMTNSTTRGLAILLFLFAAHLYGQTITGVVSGTIVDSSGLSVAGASVTLLNMATSLRTGRKLGSVGRIRVSIRATGNL